MAKIKVSIVNPFTLKLEEKGEVGDTIDLKELQTVDNTAILTAIKNKQDETYNALLAQERKQQELETKNALNELEKKLNKEYSLLKEEKDKAIENLKSSQDKILSEKDLAIRLLEEKLKSKDDLNKLELDKELAKLKQQHTEEVSQKDLELAQLRLAKTNLQTKVLGEELEKWCNAEYESYALSGFTNCKWYKDTKAIRDTPDEKATKGDYIFEVYTDSKKNPTDKILAVCCEMKTESPETKTKTKNSEHYKKLDQDRIKKNCQYALLISELEWDMVNDPPIKKIAEYENMYMVRPAYFISFLSLIKSLASKYQNLLIERKIADENFKETQSIIQEFENFKTTYLDKPLASLEKDVEDIKKEANKAYEASYKIVGLADKIISNKISEIKVKIERFDIKKIARKIDKLNDK
ncbi:MAG: DUF2130 domain-containing protein [Bacilli bacterium]